MINYSSITFDKAGMPEISGYNKSDAPVMSEMFEDGLREKSTELAKVGEYIKVTTKGDLIPLN